MSQPSSDVLVLKGDIHQVEDQIWNLLLRGTPPAQFVRGYASSELAVKDYLDNFIYSQVDNLPRAIETKFGNYKCPEEIGPLLLEYIKRHKS